MMFLNKGAQTAPFSLRLSRGGAIDKVLESDQEPVSLTHDTNSNRHEQSSSTSTSNHHNRHNGKKEHDQTELRRSVSISQRLLDGSMENVEFRDSASSSSNTHPTASKLQIGPSLNHDIVESESEVDTAIARHPSHRRAKNSFTCDITNITRSCPRSDNRYNTEQQARFLERHIDDLVSNTIHNLRSHVKGLGQHYEVNNEHLNPSHIDRNLTGTLNADKANDKQYSFDENSLLKKANFDLVQTACYLHKARKDAEDFGDRQTAQKLGNMLFNNTHNFYQFLCKLRMWMDAVNVTVSDIIEIEHSERFAINLAPHVRKSWDYAILTTLSEYLERLESDLKLVQLFKNL